jgi:hypothetical protein
MSLSFTTRQLYKEISASSEYLHKHKGHSKCHLKYTEASHSTASALSSLTTKKLPAYHHPSQQNNTHRHPASPNPFPQNPIPSRPPHPPPKESPELHQWRIHFQKLIIKLYKEKPCLLSELNKLATAAFGKNEWARAFMRGRRNGVYNSEELFICETLQKIGVVGEKRMEDSVQEPKSWAGSGEVWRRFRRGKDVI